MWFLSVPYRRETKAAQEKKKKESCNKVCHIKKKKIVKRELCVKKKIEREKKSVATLEKNN